MYIQEDWNNPMSDQENFRLGYYNHFMWTKGISKNTVMSYLTKPIHMGFIIRTFAYICIWCVINQGLPEAWPTVL